jgi:hypothetical protein
VASKPVDPNVVTSCNQLNTPGNVSITYWQGGTKTEITARLTAHGDRLMPDRPGRRLKGSRYGNNQEGMIMRIRLTRAGYVLAAGVAVTAMLGMGVGAAAGATARPDATAACGAACSDVSFVNPGASFILGVRSGIAVQRNVVRLLQGSNSASKEDFSQIALGTVFPVYCTATGQAQIGSVFTSKQCALLDHAGLLLATTFQLAFNPNNGGSTQLCVGAWNPEVANGWKLRLSACGVAADTVMIQAGTLPGGTTATGSFWLINGASDNFSNPLVATSSGVAGDSQPTWSTESLNGLEAIDTQETVFTAGPF